MGQMAGCITAIASSGLIHTVLSFAMPQDYDWKSMGEISLLDDDQRGLEVEELTPEKLDAASSWVKKYGYGFTVLIVVVWPVLSLPAGVFTKGYWSFWVFVSLMWGFVASFGIITLPLYESKAEILNVLYGLVGKKYTEAQPIAEKPE